MLTERLPSFHAQAQIVTHQYQAEQSISSSHRQSSTYRDCQSISPAVVTIYAGKEIGSGSIVRTDGFIITNYHVVQDAIASERSGWLSVRTLNGNRYPGQVIKIDRQHDLALIQLKAWKYFPVVRIAGTNSIRTGQKVYAIGSPFGCPGVLTEGVLSRIRSNGDLQSQLMLNPGNSGGPLLNSRGEMIGVNRGILQTPSGSNTGISFATNLTIAKLFISNCLEQIGA